MFRRRIHAAAAPPRAAFSKFVRLDAPDPVPHSFSVRTT